MPSNASGPARAGTLVALATLVATLLAACSGGDDTGPRTAAVARVAVSGASDSLTVGDRRSLVVALTDANGTAVAGRRVTWSSSDAAVATVDTTGVVSALAPGRTTVTAESEGVRGELTVAVRRRPVASLTIDRPVDTLWLGRTHTLRAQPGAADGSTLTDRTVTWTSADTALLAIAPAADGSVVARGVALGTTRLTARSEGVESVVPVVIIPVPIASVDIVSPDTVLVGRAAILRARALAPDGSLLGSADLAGRTVAWSSDRTAQLTVAGVADPLGHTSSGLTANALAVAAGNATVTASLDGKQGRYTIITARTTVARFTFPASATLTVGQAATVGALPFDAQGLPVAGAQLVYALTSGAGVVRLAATTAADGGPAVRIDALAPGTATIAVSADGRSATLTATVTAAGTSIRVYPTSIATVPGARGQLAPSIDSAGVALPVGTVAYRTSNAAVVTIDAAGRLTAVAPGSASLLATVGGATVTVPVTVSPAPTSDFHIDVRPVGTVPPEVVAAAQRAAQRWERVVVGGLLPAQVDLGPSECDIRTPAFHENVRSLVVFLKSEPIDGSRGTLAFAGPCVMREAAAGGLPLVGAMTIDSADVSLLTGATGALAEDVITHELGHVLGIGTMWAGSTAGRFVQDIGSDVRFVGAAATAAVAQIGLGTTGIGGAAVEDLGGYGTAGVHWRERTFLGELMTGWINPSPNPLSVVTVMSLRDLGYEVTETGADIVTATTIAGGPTFSSSVSTNRIPLPNRGITSPMPLGERLLRPKFVAGPRGTRRAVDP
ncbi:MAG: Ig-like domain-containing protein [Gemmatirosa sp.]|nr:Ig-like domain-containing protein [Gemmatirosa sp.]